jgi:hypothetical protein
MADFGGTVSHTKYVRSILSLRIQQENHFADTPSGVHREETSEDIDNILFNEAWDLHMLVTESNAYVPPCTDNCSPQITTKYDLSQTPSVP